MGAYCIALLTLCCSLSACSLLFSASEGDPEATDDEISVTKQIGAGLDFSSPQDWVSARRGNLITRQVFAVGPGMLTFVPGENVTGTGNCTGKFRPENESTMQQSILTLDDVSGTCDPGEELRGDDSNATARIVSLAKSGTIEIGLLADDTLYTDPLVIDGSTADADHYMSLSVEAAHRHKGLAGKGPRFSPSDNSHAIAVYDDFTRLGYLQVSEWTDEGSGGYDGIYVEANAVQIMAALVYEDGAPRDGTATSNGITLEKENAELTVINSIVYDVGRSAINLRNVSGGSLNVFNCTLYNCMAASSQDTGGCVTSNETVDGHISLKNTIGLLAASSAGKVFQVDMGSNFDKFANNLSNDDSATSFGTNGIVKQIADDLFVSSLGTVNLHIRETSSAANAGENLSLDFKVDVDDDARPANGAWDIGADQI